LAATTARLSAPAGQPVSRVNASRAAGAGSLARHRSGDVRPASSQPRARAVAMRPAPRKPIRAGPSAIFPSPPVHAETIIIPEGPARGTCWRRGRPPVISIRPPARPAPIPTPRASMSITNQPPLAPPAPPPHHVRGWRTLGLLNRYQWFVFVVAALGWL